MDDKSWESLLHAIEKQRCTPFLGTELIREDLDRIGRECAERFSYPLQDSDNLARVSQFSVTEDPTYAKDEISTSLKAIPTPDFKDPADPHRVLADLPIPVYITTNYTNFMMEALRYKQRDPVSCLCKWNKYIPDSVVSEPPAAPTPANPVVYHLYGHIDVPESLVLTEDDYLEFLAKSSKEKVIPSGIERLFSRNSLVFLGYRLIDLEFRILLRSLLSYMDINPYSQSKSHVSVQVVTLDNPDNSDQREKIKANLDKYCENNLDMHVFWGTCSEFMSELRRRWEIYSHGK
jgi:hypothetical protein